MKRLIIILILLQSAFTFGGTLESLMEEEPGKIVDVIGFTGSFTTAAVARFTNDVKQFAFESTEMKYKVLAEQELRDATIQLQKAVMSGADDEIAHAASRVNAAEVKVFTQQKVLTGIIHGKYKIALNYIENMDQNTRNNFRKFAKRELLSKLALGLTAIFGIDLLRRSLYEHADGEVHDEDEIEEVISTIESADIVGALSELQNH